MRRRNLSRQQRRPKNPNSGRLPAWFKLDHHRPKHSGVPPLVWVLIGFIVGRILISLAMNQ